MPKQLNVDLAFTADTSQAKRQLQELQQQLAQLASGKTLGSGGSFHLTEDLKSAVDVASKLRVTLKEATDVNTGKLDLTKFQESMQASEMTIGKYKDALMSLGPDGQKAFASLASSITQAEIPMRRTNALLNELGVTLKNAARWQISSSLIHGFMGAIQSAYGYAQDLNESLNNIRIVTGLSADEMAVFADEANKSAQALSASTLAYTDAALIYYQQGIRDQDEIQSRVDTTIKLSNVTGQSAEQVSSYMTAIWNNFYDGSQSLESYADKITALGAATASSSEEIARGLQQFASLGSSLGLNYDDAVAALATVVAQTRQSASTVGNSFRTLLQRFESLKLGDTLEDGVDLTKYSEALNKVGVQVLDVNGEMRDMSDVIQDLGAKWQTLSQAQKNALAQTVGGVRNANTMIAWMENFDKFQENLATAQGAEGELQRQQDIYAQGWEAAQKRVRAAWEAIYQDLIDDKFFITLLNGLEKVLKGIDNFIDGIGGLKGVLVTLGTVAFTVFQDKIAKGIDSAIFNLKMMTKAGQDSYGQMKQRANQELVDAYSNTDSSKDIVGQAYAQQGTLNNAYLDNVEKMTDFERQIAQIKLDQQKELIENIRLQALENEKLEEKLDLEETALQRRVAQYNKKNPNEDVQIKDFGVTMATAKEGAQATGQMDVALTQLNKIKIDPSNVDSVREAKEEITAIIQSLEKTDVLKVFGEDAEQVCLKLKLLADSEDLTEEQLKELVSALQEATIESESTEAAWERLEEIFVDLYGDSDETRAKLGELREEFEQNGASAQALAGKMGILNGFTATTVEGFNQIQQKAISSSESLVALGGQFMAISMAVNQVKGLIDTFNDDSLSGWEKFIRILSAVGMLMPTAMRLLDGEKWSNSIAFITKAFAGWGLAIDKDTLSLTAEEIADKKAAAQKAKDAATTEYLTAVENMGTIAKIKHTIAQEGLNVALGKGALAAGKFLLAILPYVAAAAAVGAAIWVVVKALEAWKASTPEGKLEAATKEAEEARSRLEEVKQQYDDLNSSLESYKNLQESINEMDETDRARAVAEQNDQLRELILSSEKYKELFRDGNGNLKFEYDKNGLLEISEAQEEALKKMALQEESLARQLALEKEIAEEEANRVVEDKNSGAKSITVTEKGHIDAGGGESTAGWSAQDYTYQADVTTQIADALASANITDLQSADGKAVEEALRNAGFDGAQLNEIMNQLGAIKMDNELANQWNSLIAEHTGYLENLDAQKEAYAREALGSEALEEASPFGDVQDAIVQDFLGLTDEQQQIIREAVINEGKTLEEAWAEAGANLEQTIEDSTTQMRMNLLDNVMKAGDLQGNAEGQQEAVDWFNGLDEEQLKILGTLEIDKDTSFEEIKAQVEELSHQITVEVDADVDEEELENLTKYVMENAESIDELDDHLKDCEAEAKKVAHAILRFDDAIQDVTKNYDKWNKALSSGSWQDAAAYVDELKDAYGDLLDIDGSTLTDDFIRDTENLELMKQAAEGSEEAYKQLQAAAGQDILGKFDLDDTEAMNKFNADLAFIQGYDSSVFGNIADLEAGASLNDQAFLDELTRMVDIAGMSAAEAEAYLASLGIDAEVKEVPAETTPVTSERQYWQPATYHTEPEETGGEENPGVYKKLVLDTPGQWVPSPETHEEQSSPNAFSLQVTSAHKSTGGGIKFSNASHGGGGSGGGGGGKGSCFAAGTLITTNNCYENIEDIKVGDIVLSYNEKTKKNEFSEVLQTMIHFVHEKIYNLFVKNDKLVVTGNHKFLITHKGQQEWIEASNIQIGDFVLLADGTLCEISDIDIETKFLTVYNFEVSNTHNYYVGKNQILVHNKGGGGGSGKAKKKKVEKPKEKKESIKEKDRYHNITEQIEDLNTEMERLNKNKDRAYGKDRIKYMDQEIDKTKKQIGLTKEYIREIKDYAKQDKAALEKTLKDIGMNDKQIGAQFDENGVLKDYEALLEAIQDKFDKTATAAYNKAIDDYNKAVEVFNASDQEDAATEAFEKAKEELEKAEDTYGKQKDAYDKQLDSLKQYEDTMNLLQEKQQELIDQMNDLFDKALELASYKIEIQLDVNDRDLQHLQWLYDNIGESADKVADRIANLNKQAEVSVKNIKANADGIRNIFSDLQKTYTDKNGNKIIDFSGINLDIDPTDSSSLINTVNQVVERMKTVGAEADIQTFLDKITEYEDNLMDEYRNLSDINEQITDNMREAFEEWRDQLEKNLDDNDHMQELLQSYQDIADLLGQEHMGISDEEMQQWRKSMLEIQRDAAQVAQANWNYAKDARAKAQKEYEDAIASGNQLAIDQAKAMLEEAEEFEKEAHKEFLERWKETLRMAEEIYQQSLENNEKAYQRALGGGIAPTLDKLQEQLDMQKELDHLHLDDYEKYKKLGDLQANINKQLANNPNVKVQGKLKGLLDDVNEKMAAGAEISEGEATILEKRLQLLQAEDQLMAARNAKSAVRMTRDNEGNFSYTYTADTSKIEEAQQNYADKFYDLLDYERKYSEDTQAAILQSYKEFLDKRNNIINDESLTDSEKEALLNQLERDMKAKVQFYTDEMKMVTDEMGRLKDEDWADMQQTLGRLLAEDDDFETSFEDTTLAKIAPAWNSAAEAMKAFTTAAGQLKADDLQAIADWVNTNETSMQNVGSSTLQFGKELTDVYAKLEEKSNDAKEAAKKMAEETTPKYDQMIAKGKEFSEKYGEYFSNVVTNIDKVVSAIEKLRKSLAGIEEDVDVESIMKDALGETPKSDDTNAEQFDTGGYTGSWGKRGKLAVLHQKELILNEDDTKNMLRAIDILRNIPGLNSNINVNNSIDYSGLAAVGAGDLQQQVHIDASFPNVQSYNEIELALNNLINSASQYVNRKKS